MLPCRFSQEIFKKYSFVVVYPLDVLDGSSLPCSASDIPPVGIVLGSNDFILVNLGFAVQGHPPFRRESQTSHFSDFEVRLALTDSQACRLSLQRDAVCEDSCGRQLYNPSIHSFLHERWQIDVGVVFTSQSTVSGSSSDFGHQSSQFVSG